MGDGEVVVCRTPGTTYEDQLRHEGQPGLRVHVRAGKGGTGAGDVVLDRSTGPAWDSSGSIPLSFVDRVRSPIGEAQVLTQ